MPGPRGANAHNEPQHQGKVVSCLEGALRAASPTFDPPCFSWQVSEGPHGRNGARAGGGNWGRRSSGQIRRVRASEATRLSLAADAAHSSRHVGCHGPPLTAPLSPLADISVSEYLARFFEAKHPAAAEPLNAAFQSLKVRALRPPAAGTLSGLFGSSVSVRECLSMRWGRRHLPYE